MALVVGSIEPYFHNMLMKVRLIFIYAAVLVGLFEGVPVIYAASTTIQTAHDFSFTSIDGESLPLANFRGKVVLIVNTASMCGFTSQYTGLQDLWDSYRDRGLVVLGVPSDDFGGQELDTVAEVKSFCTINYNIDFPMTDIVHVKGPAAHPYALLWCWTSRGKRRLLRRIESTQSPSVLLCFRHLRIRRSGGGGVMRSTGQRALPWLHRPEWL